MPVFSNRALPISARWSIARFTYFQVP